MQETPARRSNRERSEATRGALIAAARRLFVAKGYAETATPEIAAAAGVTRGALYHHFADKDALLRAVVEREFDAVRIRVERASPAGADARAALLAGGEAFLEAMQAPGRTRLLLLDGPAVLGRAAMDAIDGERGAMKPLAEGLAAAMAAGALQALPLAALAALLSAAFDRAALAIEAGADPADFGRVLDALITGLAPGR